MSDTDARIAVLERDTESLSKWRHDHIGPMLTVMGAEVDEALSLARRHEKSLEGNGKDGIADIVVLLHAAEKARSEADRTWKARWWSVAVALALLVAERALTYIVKG